MNNVVVSKEADAALMTFCFKGFSLPARKDHVQVLQSCCIRLIFLAPVGFIKATNISGPGIMAWFMADGSKMVAIRMMSMIHAILNNFSYALIPTSRWLTALCLFLALLVRDHIDHRAAHRHVTTSLIALVLLLVYY